MNDHLELKSSELLQSLSLGIRLVVIYGEIYESLYLSSVLTIIDQVIKPTNDAGPRTTRVEQSISQWTSGGKTCREGTHMRVTLRYSSPCGSVCVKSPHFAWTLRQLAVDSIFSSVLNRFCDFSNA
jgi:hypothetical protein